MNNPRTDWCFKTESEPGLGGRAINYPRGKVLGGCSSINGMIYMRGQARDYDHWRQLGNAGWGWDDVLPYFRQHEDYRPRRRRSPRQPAANGASSSSACTGRSSTPYRDAAAASRHSPRHRLQPRRQSRRRLFPGQPAARRARQRRQGLPAAGAQAAQSADRPARAGQARADSRAAAPSAWKSASTAGLRQRRRAARSSWRPAPSARRICWSSRASARASGCAISASTSCMSSPGVGENLQDHLQLRLIYKITNALTLNQLAGDLRGKAGIGARISAAAQRPDVDGAEPARRLRQVGPEPGDARPRISHPAAVARPLRRAAASLSRHHRQRLQPAAGEPRQRACDVAAFRHVAVDPAELSRRPRATGGSPPRRSA